MNNRNNRGLTLVELIVVIGVLAMILSMAIPKIQKNRFVHLAISRTVRDDLRSTRYIKMSEGKDYRILFQKYSYYILEGSKLRKTITLDKGYSIAQNFKGSEIKFDYNGVPVVGGGTVVILDDGTKKYYEVTVVPATGRILLKNKICNGYSGIK